MYPESDIAEAIPHLDKAERLQLYKLLGDETVSDIFAHLDDVEDYIEELSNEKVADIIEEMDADDAIDVLEELDDDKRQEIIKLLDEETANDIILLDQYDEDLIGSRMTTNFITINCNMSVKEATKSVIEQAADNDNISTIYALNDDLTYHGALTLRDLIVARPNTPLSDIVSTAYPCLYANETIQNCVDKLRDYSEDSIPLLSPENHVIGVITSSELVDITADEMEEDYAKFAGLTQQIDLEEKLSTSIKKRLPWLLFLMGLGLVVSTLIGSFSFVIAALPLLVGFQSLILDMSGNIGTQSLAVTIRVITNDDLNRKDKIKLVLKELRIGIINGLVIGLLSTLVCSIYVFLVPTGPDNYFESLKMSSCIGIALLSAMTCASLSGTLVPLLFKKLKIDPAVASGPLLTSLNDLIAATVYYGIAWAMLLA